MKSTIFHLFYSIFTPFPFFLASFFPIRQQKFPGQKSLGGHSAPLPPPPPACYATVSSPATSVRSEKLKSGWQELFLTHVMPTQSERIHYQNVMKLPQISHKNLSFKSRPIPYLERFRQLLFPYKLNGRDIYFLFHICQLWAVKLWPKDLDFFQHDLSLKMKKTQRLGLEVRNGAPIYFCLFVCLFVSGRFEETGWWSRW